MFISFINNHILLTQALSNLTIYVSEFCYLTVINDNGNFNANTTIWYQFILSLFLLLVLYCCRWYD